MLDYHYHSWNEFTSWNTFLNLIGSLATLSGTNLEQFERTSFNLPSNVIDFTHWRSCVWLLVYLLCSIHCIFQKIFHFIKLFILSLTCWCSEVRYQELNIHEKRLPIANSWVPLPWLAFKALRPNYFHLTNSFQLPSFP